MHKDIRGLEKRPDCAEFELKEYGNQCGDCQTDGHYLCINCKHIACFEEMEIGDNCMRYYPKRYAEQERINAEIALREGDL